MKIVDVVELNPWEVEPPIAPLRNYDEIAKTRRFKELTETVRLRGVIQEPLVRLLPDGRKRCVFGWTRVLATREAAKEADVKIKVKLAEMSDKEEQSLPIIENLYQQGLEWGVLAERVSKMTGEENWGIDEVAVTIGKSEEYIRTLTWMWNSIPEKLKEAARRGEIPFRVAVHTPKVPEEKRADFIERAIAEGWKEWRVKEEAERLREGKESLGRPAERRMTIKLPEKGEARVIFQDGEQAILKLPSVKENEIKDKLKMGKQLSLIDIASETTTVVCFKCKKEFRLIHKGEDKHFLELIAQTPA